MPGYQADLSAAEDSVRGARGVNLSGHPIQALDTNHTHCWIQLLVSARDWRWLGAPETLGSYSWLRKGKEVFFMPSCRVGRQFGLQTPETAPENPCPYPRCSWLCSTGNSCFSPGTRHSHVDAGHFSLFFSLPMIFFFLLLSVPWGRAVALNAGEQLTTVWEIEFLLKKIIRFLRETSCPRTTLKRPNKGTRKVCSFWQEGKSGVNNKVVAFHNQIPRVELEHPGTSITLTSE